MAVKEIVGKRMIKHEKVVRKKQSEPIQEVSNPLIYTGDEKSNLYGEIPHYQEQQNNNVKIEQLIDKLGDKIDLIGTKTQTGTKAVEVDIKRAITFDKVDKNAVKSEVIRGKVKTKTNKLRELRQRNNK